MVYVDIYLKVLLISVCLEVNVYVIYSIWGAFREHRRARQRKREKEQEREKERDVEKTFLTLGLSRRIRNETGATRWWISHGLLFTRIRRFVGILFLQFFLYPLIQYARTHARTYAHYTHTYTCTTCAHSQSVSRWFPPLISFSPRFLWPRSSKRHIPADRLTPIVEFCEQSNSQVSDTHTSTRMHTQTAGCYKSSVKNFPNIATFFINCCTKAFSLLILYWNVFPPFPESSPKNHPQTVRLNRSPKGGRLIPFLMKYRISWSVWVREIYVLFFDDASTKSHETFVIN